MQITLILVFSKKSCISSEQRNILIFCFTESLLQGVSKKVDSLYLADNSENPKVDRVGQHSK